MVLLCATAHAAGPSVWTAQLSNTSTGASYTGGPYATKAQAVAAMESFDAANDPNHYEQQLVETAITNMSSTTVTYTYGPAGYGQRLGFTSYSTCLAACEAPNFFYSLSSLLQYWNSLHPNPCVDGQPSSVNITFAPVGQWMPLSPQTIAECKAGNLAYCASPDEWPQEIPILRTTTGTNSYPPYVCQTTTQLGWQNGAASNMFRWTLPAPTNNPNPYVGSVTGQLVGCASGGAAPTLVGDPCDVSTGDFSQAEPDYSAAGLSFTRYYHSANLESSHNLGVGWTHNYAAYLVMGPLAPLGLLRPDGFHDAVQSINGELISLSGAGIHILQSGSNWVAYMADGSSEVYNGAGQLTQKVTAAGLATKLQYNSTTGLLSSVTGPFGHTLQFTYDSKNRLASVIEPDGSSTITYGYDGNNNLTSVAYPDGTQRQYQYQDSNYPNNLTEIVDESNNVSLTVQYDDSGGTGGVIKSQQAGGSQAVSITYSASSATVIDALGATNTYAFTSNSGFAARVTSVTRNGLMQAYTVAPGSTDPQQRVTQYTDPNGNVTTYSYDADHLTSKTEAYGTGRARTTSYQYLSTNTALPTLVTEALKQTAYAYYAGTNLVQTETVTDTTVTPHVSRVWSYTYDADGRVLTVKGPRNDLNSTTTYTYYTCTTGVQCGQLQTITDPVGNVTTYNTYNAQGQPLTITDPNGVVTTLTYDSRQRLTSRQVGAETTGVSYYPTGLLKQVTLPDSSFVLYTYDGAHRLTQVSDQLGNKIVYTLDGMGNRTAETSYDPGGVLHRTHSRVFNALNELYQDINAAGTSAVTTTYAYDNNGNETSVSAPLARNTTNAFDELNRLTKITDPASGVSQLGYDANDALTSIVDPRNFTTSYQRDGFGELVQQTSPDTGIATYAYDSAGNLATATDARSAVTTYTYDALNRPTSVGYSSGGVTDQTLAFTYDSGTNGKGRLTGASDANHTLGWSYDDLGRVVTKTQTVGTVTLSTSYGYTNGDLATLTTPSGQRITYAYNSNHEVVSITLNATNILNSVTYEPFGSVDGWTWGNGTAATRSYDTDGYISQISSAGTKTYTFDNALRITGIADAGNSALSWTYGYDALDRLNSAAASGQTQGFTYDANGNRLTQTGTTSITYNVAPGSNRLGATTGALTRSYTYDSAGNVLSYGTPALAYSNAGRLVSVTNGPTSATYIHDALGERVSKTVGGTTTYFAYDLFGHLLGEYDGTGALIQEIVWMGDTPVASVRPTSCGLGIFYIHTDHLNTPRRITRRSTSDIVWRWDADPFGDTAPNPNPSGLGTFTFNLRFPGQYYDAESGLIQNYHRDYDPLTGRYVESDPIGPVGGINSYGYALQNPVSGQDPLGLYCVSTGQSVSCSYPGGPAFTLPVAGFPDINASYRALYHKYDVQRAIGCAKAQYVMQALINNPTPGAPNPATPSGTPNNAPALLFSNNPVISYLTTDLNSGLPLVVNITGPNSAFNPGYVAREVVDGVAHSYGEGLNPWQSPAASAQWLQDLANEYVWGRQMSTLIKQAQATCDCRQ